MSDMCFSLAVSDVAYQHSIPVCVFQPPVDYRSLTETREHRIQAGDRFWGMCYFSGRLYTTEGRKETWPPRFSLAVCSVTNHDTVTLLDKLDLDGE